VLSRAETEAVYDRIGRWQDVLAFYELPAFDALTMHGAFDEAHAVYEVGCGTGRLAERLLRSHCPPGAQYEGVDLSAGMVQAARDRLARFGERATVRRADATLGIDSPNGSQDRVLATYLLDLLSIGDAHALLAEAHRLLRDHGLLCVAGLTWGASVVSRTVSGLWDVVHRCVPRWVGGCRPLRMRSLLDPARWRVRHHAVVTAWGVPSEMLIAAPV